MSAELRRSAVPGDSKRHNVSGEERRGRPPVQAEAEPNWAVLIRLSVSFQKQDKRPTLDRLQNASAAVMWSGLKGQR